MNAAARSLALERQALVARSALCRLRLRRQAGDVRTALLCKRTALDVATAPAMRRIAFALVLSLVGFGRTARLLVLATQILIVGKVAAKLIARFR